MFALQAPLAVALTAVAAVAPTQRAWIDPPPAVPAQATVAHGASTRLLVNSRGLYWTTVRGVQSNLLRSSKTGRPGQEQRLLTFPVSSYRLGAIAYAPAGTPARAWVVRNNRLTPGSTIRQFAGPERRIITSRWTIDTRDLVTNGRYLFWADTNGIRRMPVTGGPLKTLYWGTGLRHVGVAGGYVYFSQGKQIFRTNLSGGGLTKLIPRETEPVTAMYVRNSTVYYGLRNGVVRSKTGLNPTVAYRSSRTDSVTSISLHRNRIVWSWCARTTGDNCTIRFVGNNIVYSAGNRVHDLQSDGRWLFYANSAGVQRR